MIHQVTIARVIDALPLVASMDDNDEYFVEYKQQSKMLLKKLNHSSPARCSIATSNNYVFHYIIEAGVCYLVLCDAKFSKKLAYGYLEEIQREFHELYGSRVDTAARPYAFIEFDGRMKKLKRSYEDSRATNRLDKINSELQDVQRIMVKNIDDVLERDGQLDTLSSKASALRDQSSKYLKDAKQLKWKAMLQKYGPIAATSTIVLVFLYFFFGL
eukprot:TRINITY_DN8903_c0_g1_i2.p2 TRINITY_DN8903_c0_g1~~TRINITY_DN8903_c0_g1_i2.p2  ORF type:complete len:215 (+),score=42.45 TRINITY_DN8903_c0_g1_i2:1754-2398(+)